MATSEVAQELELYVKMIGGIMLYHADRQAWTVHIRSNLKPHGSVQILIDEGTPLQEALDTLRTAYETANGVEST